VAAVRERSDGIERVDLGSDQLVEFAWPSSEPPGFGPGEVT
jgi:hypothetical protein